MFRKGKKVPEIEEKFDDLQNNMENNYKDLALQAYEEAKQMIFQYYYSGKLKEKEYQKYIQKLNLYTQKLKHYSHTDMSSFLKERY